MRWSRSSGEAECLRTVPCRHDRLGRPIIED